MEDQDLQTWGEQLTEEIARETKAGRSKKWRCPQELRLRVLSYGRVCRERGDPYLDIAVRLGLIESTLTRWFRTEKAKGKPGFRSVSIVPAAEVENENLPVASTFRLVTPHGYRVEGLDAESLAYLLRVVG
jgi:hypothetical protein